VSQPELICIPGWAGTAEAWNGVLSVTPWASTCKKLQWWDCLDESCGELGRVIGSSPEPVVLLGCSLGAMISLRAASHWPDKVSRLVLVSGTAHMAADGDWPGVDARALRAMRSKLRTEPDAVLEDFTKLCFAPLDSASVVDRFTPTAEVFPAQALVRGLEYLTKLDLRPLLATIETPALVLHGSKDRVVPAAAATELARSMPNATLQLFDGVGHALPFVAAGRLARAIRGFIIDERAA